MQVHGYPGLDAHRDEHVLLIRRVLEFQREFEAGRVALTVAVLQFVKDWLTRHIASSDRRIGTWLSARSTA